MRKIEQKMVYALKNKRKFKRDNTRVDTLGNVYLHRRRIAERLPSGYTRFSLAGWGTVTTRSRLSALGVRVFQRNFAQMALGWDKQPMVLQEHKVYLANPEGYVVAELNGW